MNIRCTSLVSALLILGLGTSAQADKVPTQAITAGENLNKLTLLYEKTKNSEVLTTLQDVIKHQQEQTTIQNQQEQITIQNKHNKTFWGVVAVPAFICLAIITIALTHKKED